MKAIRTVKSSGNDQKTLTVDTEDRGSYVLSLEGEDDALFADKQYPIFRELGWRSGTETLLKKAHTLFRSGQASAPNDSFECTVDGHTLKIKPVPV